MNRKPSLITAAMTAALLAAPAAANPLLNERWIAKASYEQVQKAIAGGADPDAARSGYTALMVASKEGNHGAIRTLCEAGADGNRPAKPGQHGPLHFAADAEAVALLHDCGAVVWARNSNGLTPLHYAAQDNRFSAMEALIRRGADVDAPGAKFGTTPLHDAAQYGHPAAVQILLEAGADVNAATAPIGNTPLHRAARYGNPAVVQILLEAGAEINATNSGNFTPLHKAATHNIPEVVEVLIDAGANPAIRDEDGLYPADLARKRNRKLRGHPVMARLEVGMTTASPAATPGCDGYVVQASDRRLGDVALKVLGDRARWTEIARLNGITAQAPHRVGQCLALP